MRNPLRSSAWSSASTIRIVMRVVGCLAVAQRGADLPATCRPGAGMERAPERSRPLGHPREPVPSAAAAGARLAVAVDVAGPGPGTGAATSCARRR